MLCEVKYDERFQPTTVIVGRGIPGGPVCSGPPSPPAAPLAGPGRPSASLLLKIQSASFGMGLGKFRRGPLMPDGTGGPGPGEYTGLSIGDWNFSN